MGEDGGQNMGENGNTGSNWGMTRWWSTDDSETSSGRGALVAKIVLTTILGTIRPELRKSYLVGDELVRGRKSRGRISEDVLTKRGAWEFYVLVVAWSRLMNTVYPTLTTQKPPRTRKFGNFSPILIKLGWEVVFRVSNRISANCVAGYILPTPKPPQYTLAISVRFGCNLVGRSNLG